MGNIKKKKQLRDDNVQIQLITPANPVLLCFHIVADMSGIFIPFVI